MLGVPVQSNNYGNVIYVTGDNSNQKEKGGLFNKQHWGKQAAFQNNTFGPVPG